MTTFSPAPPPLLLQALLLDDYTIVMEDDHNWCVSKDDAEEPIIVPKKGEMVALEIIDDIRAKAGWDNKRYLQLIGKASANTGIAWPQATPPH